MAATELATAYVSLVPSLKGAGGSIAKELGGIDLTGSGKAMGSSMGGGLLSSLKGLVGPALAVLGSGMFAGFISEAAKASDATDKFKSTMNFAGLDTSAIDAATKAAKGYADQTVYDLPTIQATMAQLASNGVTNYTDLTKAAGNLNAVAGGNAETFKSVSRTLTQSAGAGKLMTEDWNMLADAIPGASGVLQKSMKEAGAYTGNFKDAMAAGEITSTEFQDALMKLGNDPVAVEAAKSVTTFEGAIGGLEATINSGLMGALDAMKPAITGAINGVAAGLSAMFGFFGSLFSGLKSLIMDGDITPDLLNALGVEEDSPIIGGLMWLQDKLWAAFTGIRNFIAGFTIPADSLTSQLNGAFSPAFAVGIKLQQGIQAALGGVRDFLAGFTLPSPNLEGLSGNVRPLVMFGAQLRDVFNQIATAIGPLIPNVVQLWSSLSPLQLIFQSIQPFLPQLLAMFGQLASVVGGALVSAITGILPAVMTLQSVFVGLLQGVLAQVLPVVIQLITMLGATFTQLLPILIPIITQVVTLAATLVSQLAPIFMQLVSTVMPMVVTILGAVLSAIGPLISMIAGLLIPIIQALMPVVVTVFSVIASVIGSVMQIVMGIIQVVTGIISGNWGQVWNGIVNIFSGVWNLIVTLVRGALQIVGQVVISGLGLVGGFIGGALAGIGRFFADTWNNIVNGASGMIGGLLGFFGGLGGKILGALGNVGSTLFSAGKNIVQGLIDGIGSMLGAIGRAVINIVPEAIRGPFEQLMGIHSPSLVARGWGHHIGTGLVLGLEDEYDPIAEATALLVKPPALPSFASAGARAAYSAGALAPATGYSGPLIHQDVHPAEKMSETNLAEIAARKIVGALT